MHLSIAGAGEGSSTSLNATAGVAMASSSSGSGGGFDVRGERVVGAARDLLHDEARKRSTMTTSRHTPSSLA